MYLLNRSSQNITDLNIDLGMGSEKNENLHKKVKERDILKVKPTYTTTYHGAQTFNH